jgi:SNF2 family DNA or RNA helicase
MTYFIVKVNGKILRECVSSTFNNWPSTVAELTFDEDENIKVFSGEPTLEHKETFKEINTHPYKAQIGDVFEFIDVETFTVIKTYIYKG